MRPLILGDLSKRTQTRSGPGVVCNFLTESGGLRPPHPPLSTKNCESHFRQLVFTWEQSAKVRLCKTAPLAL